MGVPEGWKTETRRGCSPLQSLSAGSVALWMVNVDGGREGVANERKRELGSPLFVAGIGGGVGG